MMLVQAWEGDDVTGPPDDVTATRHGKAGDHCRCWLPMLMAPCGVGAIGWWWC